MKLGKYEVSLAKQPKPKIVGTEQGSSGSPVNGYFELESMLGKIRNPNIKQIMDMIDNDGTAQALYNFITFPVEASDWHLVPDPEDVVVSKDSEGNKIEDHPQSDFVESALRNPQHKGGMSTPFSLVISDMLLAVAQGFRFFEIVYKINEQGMVVFQKVVSREANDIDIQTDDTGGFNGITQQVMRDGKSIKVTIDLQFCFLFTYKKQRNKLKGASAFRAAFYHYDKKHRLYYLQNQQAQGAALGIKTLTAPDGAKQEDRDANLSAVDKMAVRPTIALPFGWGLTVTQPSKGLDMQPSIDGHDIQMARSVLAQGLLQGNSSQSSGGSYSLGEVHFDSFMLGVLGLMNNIEEHINAFLISKLIDLNFDKPLYPTFKFNPPNDDVSELLREGFKSLIAKGAVPKWVANGMSDKVAERLEIERPEDDGVSADDNDYIGITNTPANPALSRYHEHSKKKDSQRKLDSSDWWREVTAVETKVQFTKIEKQANDAELTILDSLRDEFDAIKAETGKLLEPILKGEDPANALDEFVLPDFDKLQTIMQDGAVDTYGKAKTQAADEISKKAPANKPASKELINQHVKGIIEKQQSDLLFSVKTKVTDAVRKNLLAKVELDWKSILNETLDLFDVFFDDKETLTVNSLITFAINIGRDDVFQENSNDIYGYQYSALLDDAVCPICEDLDGSIATPEEYYNTIWMPPIHFNCRCIWVAIMKDEAEKPDFTGIPTSPGGADAPSLSKDHTDGAFEIYLSKGAEALWQQKRR